MSVTTGFPSVSVPVLSIITVSIFPAVSRLTASLIRIPFSAPLPMPTMTAVGVASPNAHGQAITSTVTAARIPCVMPPDGSKTSHRTKESRAMPMIVGTNMPAILSASFCTGALLPCASWTMRII